MIEKLPEIICKVDPTRKPPPIIEYVRKSYELKQKEEAIQSFIINSNYGAQVLQSGRIIVVRTPVCPIYLSSKVDYATPATHLLFLGISRQTWRHPPYCT